MPSKRKKDDSFKEHVLDMLEGEGVAARPMFGGFGLSLRGSFFGLIDDGKAYFRVDDASRPRYEALGSEPFIYSRDGKSVSMNYYEVPDEALERRDELVRYAREAAEAARRAKKKSSPAKRKRRL